MTIRPLLRSGALPLAGLLSALAFSAPALKNEKPVIDPGEGRALVQDLLGRMPSENAEILGLLRIRRGEGTLEEIPVKMTIRVGEGAWRDIYETQPGPNRPGEILIITHRLNEPNEYLHGRFRAGETPPKPKAVQGAGLYRPLAGSDFFLADLGLEFLHWPSQRIVKREMRKSRSCRVVESANPNPAAGGYSRVLSWIDVETGNIIRAEGYDGQNRKLKEFSIRKIDRNEGKVQVKEMEILNDQADTRTSLVFNYEIPAGANP